MPSNNRVREFEGIETLEDLTEIFGAFASDLISKLDTLTNSVRVLDQAIKKCSEQIATMAERYS